MLLQRKSLTSKNKKYLVIVMIFILGLFVIDLTGVGGNIYFYANWLKCGGVPYVSGSTLGGGRIPNYVKADIFNPLRLNTGPYFCTQRDAEKAGYSADSKGYEFPHLTDTENKCLALMRNNLPYDNQTCAGLSLRNNS